ncbi:Zinc finger CCCH domain-containing protein 59 [Zea mays]|uniref:Zinc finger CCCH domain-containing protein 59 n=1 Tax=Zea mays TaxID=4577 RepID=A0A1D6MHX0_MAIZE|nr:Zinc finger CCCH domain-containing protein 59 [Zea mays]
MGTHWNSKVCGGDILILVRVHLYFVLCMVTLRGDFAWYKAWNTKTGMKLRFQGPSSLVCSMAITDEMLFAGTGDGRIMAWRFPAKESNTEPVLILSGHQRPVISLSISARRLYSGSLDKTIKAWDLTTRQCVQTLSEHKAAVTSVLCWDEKLLSCSLDKTVKLWTLSESGNLQVKYTHAEENVRTALLPIMRYFCFVGCCILSIPK